MKKLTSILLVLVLTLGLMTGCGAKPQEPVPAPAETAEPEKAPDEVPAEPEKVPEAVPAEEPAEAEPSTRIITDMAGREVEIPTNIESVAALQATARIIAYAGGADKITGLTEMEQKGKPGIPHAYVNREHYGTCTAIAPGGPTREYYDEALVTLQPDIVITTYSDMDEINTMQDKLGVPVVCLIFHGMFEQNMFDAITLTGEILGTQEQAARAVEGLKTWQADLNDRTKDIPEEEKPTVYAGAVSFAGGHGIEGTYANYPPFMAINAINVVDETGEKASVMIDKEKLLVWDPDIIFLTPGNLHFVQDDYKTNPDLYNNLSAFREGRVYSQVGYNWYGCNVELAVCDAYYAGLMIYPEAFADVNFEEKAEEIFTTMLGEPYLANLELTGDFFGPITLEDIQ